MKTINLMVLKLLIFATMRNTFFISMAFTVVLLTASCESKKVDDQQKNRKPNIVYILADDLGYGELGCYGQELIETPHIDKLAENGMKFTQHYAGAPVCAPSRCSLLTGLHMGHAFVRSNDEWRERGDVWDYAKADKDPHLEGQRPIPANTFTIGKMLQKAGYKTACVGKWGLGAPFTDGVPNKQGFDFFYGYNCQRQAHNYYPGHLWKNEEKVILDNEVIVPGTKLDEGADPYDPASYAKYTQKEYAPALMQKEVLAFIERNKDRPFFLYYATPIPHDPLQAPKKWVDYYHRKFGDEEPYLGDKGYFPNRYPHATYAAMISYLDEQVGELVDKLKELGIYDHTLIIFTSDNGPTYAGGVDAPFFDSAKPFHCTYGWGKGFVHEGGIREPMIAVWEGHIKPGTQSDHISAFWDVMPTLAEVSEANIPVQIDGISFLPALTGKGVQKEHEYLYWEFPSYQGQQAVRKGDWKAMRMDILKGNMTINLYNLKDDISEDQDVAAENPGIVKDMERIMKEAHTQAATVRFRMKQLGDTIPE